MHQVWFIILYCITTVISREQELNLDRNAYELKFVGLSVPFQIFEKDGVVYFRELNNKHLNVHYLLSNLEEILSNIDKLKNVSEDTKEELKIFIKDYIQDRAKEQQFAQYKYKDDSDVKFDLGSVKEEIETSHLPKYVKEKLKQQVEKFHMSTKFLENLNSITGGITLDEVVSEIKKMHIPKNVREYLITYSKHEFAHPNTGDDVTTKNPKRTTENPIEVTAAIDEYTMEKNTTIGIMIDDKIIFGDDDIPTTEELNVQNSKPPIYELGADITTNKPNKKPDTPENVSENYTENEQSTPVSSTESPEKELNNITSAENTTATIDTESISKILLPNFEIIVIDKNKQNSSESFYDLSKDKPTRKTETEKTTEKTTEKCTSKATTDNIPKLFVDAFQEDEPKEGIRDGKDVRDYSKWWVKLYVEIMLDEDFTPICNGIFIWNNVIMTSAVCLNKHKDNLQGLYSRTMDQHEFNIKRIGFKRYWTNTRTDLALLQTIEPMATHQFAKISQSDLPKEGDKVTLISSKCGDLHYARVKVNIKQCREVFGPQQSPFCGESVKKNGRKCFENYGAPVIFRDNLIGLVSLSKMDKLSLYTNLSYFHEWWLPKIIYLQNVADGFEGAVIDDIVGTTLPKIIYMP